MPCLLHACMFTMAESEEGRCNRKRREEVAVRWGRRRGLLFFLRCCCLASRGIFSPIPQATERKQMWFGGSVSIPFLMSLAPLESLEPSLSVTVSLFKSLFCVCIGHPMYTSWERWVSWALDLGVVPPSPMLDSSAHHLLCSRQPISQKPWIL